MKSVVLDMVGQRFNDLLVIERAGVDVSPNGTKHTLWKCKCRCGRPMTVRAGDLRRRDAKQVKRCRFCKLMSRKVAGGHAMKRSPTYQSWHCMMQRVKRDSHYRHVSVCDRWKTFRLFLEDMGERPSRDHTLDRIDVSGNYEPGNCRWATRATQSRNKRSNVLVEVGGQMMVLIDACKALGVNQSTFYKRRSRGMSLNDALGLPWSEERMRL